jgi:hypothetical protein
MRLWFFLPVVAILFSSCPGNSAPIIQTLSLSSLNLNACTELTLTANAMDADNDPLTYEYAVNPTGTGVFSQNNSKTTTWALNPSRTTLTTVTFTITVSDATHTVSKKLFRSRLVREKVVVVSLVLFIQDRNS